MTDEERFIELEIKLTHQEDLIESLNQTIYEQQKKIDQLELLVTEMARRMIAISDAVQQSSPIEKPPHY